MERGRKFLSDLKLFADYFKWREDLGRYETWEEAVEDVMSGHLERFPSIKEDLGFATEMYKNKIVLASQRSLQFRAEQIKAHVPKLYNCSVMYCSNPSTLGRAFYILLCGTGLGMSLIPEVISNLPRLKRRGNETVSYTVEDSIEGWADAADVLISSYCESKARFPEYQGKIIRFDYSKIRPKGAHIAGGFKAPGHEGLQQSFERIEKLLDTETKDSESVTWRSIVAYDIFMHLADAVLSGGVRRSACNIIIDPSDSELIMAKTGDWWKSNPQRARSNNSVILDRSTTTPEELHKFISLNDGQSDLGFVLADNKYCIFNPCFEISFCYWDVIKKNNWEDIPIAQFCNLTEIAGGACKTPEEFYAACKAASILGTVQAAYTDFKFLNKETEEIVKGEALLGVSITGIAENMKLFSDPEVLQKGAEIVNKTNEELAKKIGINPAARTTCIKPSGNASVILGTTSGIHPDHSKRYFRVMQINKESEVAKYLAENKPEMIEDSVWSSTNSDYVVYVPIESTAQSFKEDLKGVKHLDLIKHVQTNWVLPGTRKDRCYSPGITHNVSATVILDNPEEIADYIFRYKEYFAAVSFLPDGGDKIYNQAPFTSVLSAEELLKEYGPACILASGLIVDGLNAYFGNLWKACDSVYSKHTEGTRVQVLIQKDWLRRVNKFANNFFYGNLDVCISCLKDVHLYHKWVSTQRVFGNPKLDKIIKKPSYKSISDYASMACSGGSCEITKL